MRILFFALLITALLPCTVEAFNVEGFTTGMSKTTVWEQAGRIYKLSTIDEDTVVAVAPDGNYLSFNFCQGKLASIQQGLKTNLQQVALVMSEFKAKYGNPISTSAGTRAHSSGTIYEWGTWWAAGTEFVSLYYMGDTQSESLSTSYQSKNKCFEIPR